DSLDVLNAERIARSLAPLDLVDESAETQSADIPSRITFFEALGIAAVDGLDVEASWQPRQPWDLLRTPLGVTSGGDLLWLDLKEQSQGGQGPHGLVAGTTGAGKSELLLTLIAGLALRHPPSVVNFVLVDYKGGDAFKSVDALPHTVSLITDLDRHLAARALATLRSEIKRREHRLLELRAAGVPSIAEYQQRGEGEPMPFLVIVVDEFARLKDELPEFIHGLIDVARVGRSLGVHLILATQTPSGTVDDQIQKNTNYGICLRVRDPHDSREVIGEPDAALLPGSLPGRGYFRAGLDPLRQFQTARVGARYEARVAGDTFEIAPFEPTCEPLRLSRLASRSVHVDGAVSRQTEVAHLIPRLAEAAAEAGNVARRWPAPLPEAIDLLDITGDQPRWDVAPDWMVGAVGLVDEPSQQVQRPFRLEVGRNCLIYGGAGAGKSTLLRTLATSLALSHAPHDLHVYCLDFDARTLGTLRDLPHCGPSGVFLPRDTLRIRRLFRMLEHDLQRRRELGISNLRQQRGRMPDAPPFVLVLLDNFAAFRETFESEEDLTRSGESMVAELATLMRDGSAAGISFVLTASVPGSVTTAVANAVETRIALRQNDPSDYSVVGRLEHPPERVPAGRGFAVGNPPREFQVAVLPEDASSLFESLRVAANGSGPLPVQDLPPRIDLDDPRLRLADGREGLPVVLGLDDEHFGPLVVDLAEAQHLVIIGPPGSGKTSLLRSVIDQTRAVPWYAVLPRTSPLTASGGFVSNARNVVQLGELLDELESVVEERRATLHHEGALSAPEPILLVFDDYELLRQDDEFYDVESRLARLARRGGVVGLHVLLAGNNVELRDARDDLVRYLSQLRVGVLLQPDLEFDGDLFSARLPRVLEPPPRGRGYFIQRQQQRLFQAALPREGETY
ncbi:MAG TPA: FtsK/SpoIIIE domain-containing protein, partial [Chloroflexota bacterium]